MRGLAGSSRCKYSAKKDTHAIVSSKILYNLYGIFRSFVFNKFRLDSSRELYKKSDGKLGRKTGYRKSKEEKAEQYAGVIKLLKKGYPVRNIAKIESVGISTVMRLKNEFCD